MRDGKPSPAAGPSAHDGRAAAGGGHDTAAAPPSTDELWALVVRARGGDPAALPLIRAHLDARPEIWAHVGDLAARVRGAWLDLLAGDDALSRECFRRKAQELRAELAGPHPTKAEEVLVDLVVANYLEAQHAQWAAAEGGGSARQAGLRLKKAESAQRRLLASLRTLATLRQIAPAGLAPLNCLRVVHQEERRPA